MCPTCNQAHRYVHCGCCLHVLHVGAEGLEAVPSCCFLLSCELSFVKGLCTWGQDESCWPRGLVFGRSLSQWPWLVFPMMLPLQVNVKVKSAFNNKLFALNVVVNIPVPDNTAKADIQTSQGQLLVALIFASSLLLYILHWALDAPYHKGAVVQRCVQVTPQ